MGIGGLKTILVKQGCEREFERLFAIQRASRVDPGWRAGLPILFAAKIADEATSLYCRRVIPGSGGVRLASILGLWQSLFPKNSSDSRNY